MGETLKSKESANIPQIGNILKKSKKEKKFKTLLFLVKSDYGNGIKEILENMISFLKSMKKIIKKDYECKFPKDLQMLRDYLLKIETSIYLSNFLNESNNQAEIFEVMKIIFYLNKKLKNRKYYSHYLLFLQ